MSMVKICTVMHLRRSQFGRSAGQQPCLLLLKSLLQVFQPFVLSIFDKLILNIPESRDHDGIDDFVDTPKDIGVILQYPDSGCFQGNTCCPL